MNCLVFFATVFLLITSGYGQTEFTSVIETASGPVRGQILTTVRKSIKYASFTGIPFGEPPVGYMRFKVIH